MGGPGYRGYVLSNLDNPEIVQEAEWNYFFKRFGYYCCGHCKSCKLARIQEELERKEREKRWFELEVFYEDHDNRYWKEEDRLIWEGSDE